VDTSKCVYRGTRAVWDNRINITDKLDKVKSADLQAVLVMIGTDSGFTGETECHYELI